MQPDFSGNDNQKVSLYNSGVAHIQRLDELCNKAHRFATLGNLPQWNWILDRVWMEVIGDLEAEDPRIEEFNRFKLVIGDLNKRFTDKKIDFEEYKRLRYEALMAKEEFLRRLQNKLGKGTKLVDADEDMID